MSRLENYLENLEIHCGEMTPGRAVVHVRLPIGHANSGFSLAGAVRGPRCSRGSTLPTTYRLAERASDLRGQSENWLRAATLITEPVFWSPDWPALYDVTLELRRGSIVVEESMQTIGLRPLTVLDKEFDFGGKFWILRGVHSNGGLDAAVRECREHAAALMAPAELLDDALLTTASEHGVLVVAQLQSATKLTAEVARLARFASVAIAVLPPGASSVRFMANHNILLAHQVEHGAKEPPADDARLVLGEVLDSWEFGNWAQSLARTVIAYRPLDPTRDIAAARAECDRLQRDLAPLGQYAGYIV